MATRKNDWNIFILIFIFVALLVGYIYFQSRNNSEKYAASPANNFIKYYANWNYSPYFTPLPVNEDSYQRYYTDLPQIVDVWDV
jgi:hypothetical protein